MLIFSCQRSTNIGYNILPDDDQININITDTLSLEVHTIKTDSVIASGVSELLLGEYTDPIFGYSKASFALQFAMGQAVNFNNTDIVDSVILSLPYNQNTNNIYGNSSAEQTVEIYKIPNDLDNQKIYYSNENPDLYTGDLVGSTTYYPVAADTILNIKLDNSLGEYFITADQSNFDSIQSFHTFFKGLYIKAESNNDDGAIVKFNMNSALIMIIYFHRDNNSNFQYKITANNSLNVRFNLIEHDYTSADFAGPIDDNTLPQDTVAYLQAGSGLYIKIQVPFLKNLNNFGNIVINRAELIINTIPENLSSENTYPAINKTFITGFVSDTSSILIPDYITQTSYSGELYEDGTYKFDITAYVQNILSGATENKGIKLFPAFDNSDVARSIITTGKNSRPMKLVITYTKI